MKGDFPFMEEHFSKLIEHNLIYMLLQIRTNKTNAYNIIMFTLVNPILSKIPLPRKLYYFYSAHNRRKFNS